MKKEKVTKKEGKAEKVYFNDDYGKEFFNCDFGTQDLDLIKTPFCEI